MKKFDFKMLANQIMFDLNEQEQQELQNDFEILKEQIDFLNEIDTDKVAEMIYPFEEATMYLREDVVEHVLSQEDALKNASDVKMGHVHVPKVVAS